MSNPHDGHRERMRNRFLQDAASLADHELIELMLFYSLPRKNTNELAHALLNRFSSLKGVFTADMAELCDVPGMGGNSAVLVKCVAELAARFYTEKEKRIGFYTVAEAAEYIVDLLYPCTSEELHIFCLDSGLKLIGSKKLAEGSVIAVAVNTRHIVKTAINMDAVYVILAHNHPGSSPFPSIQDIEMTNSISSVLEGVGIKLCDHIITSGRQFYSFSKGCEYNVDREDLMHIGEMYDE